MLDTPPVPSVSIMPGRGAKARGPTSGAGFDLHVAANETRLVLFFDSPRVAVDREREVQIIGVRFEIVRVLPYLLKQSLHVGATQVVISTQRTSGKVVLPVTDNGVGLPPETMAIPQKKPLAPTRFLGTGLTICGTSPPGGGPVFTFKFPLSPN